MSTAFWPLRAFAPQPRRRSFRRCTLRLTLAFALLSAGVHGADETVPPESSISAANPAPVRPSAPRETAGKLAPDAELGRELPADTTILTLESGKERFHALLQEPARPEPHGAILLLADPYTGPAWPTQIEALHFALARQGWATLAVEPPPPTPVAVPERTLPVRHMITQGATVAENASVEPAQNAGTPVDMAATTPDSGNNDVTPEAAGDGAGPGADALDLPAPFHERLAERLELGWNELERFTPPIRILLAVGRSVPWAVSYAQRHPELALQLVLIDAQPDPIADAPNLGASWNDMTAKRILDLYHLPLPADPEAAPNARMRREQATRAQLLHYHQSTLPGPFTGWQPEMPWLTSRVRGLIENRILEPLQMELEQARKLADNAPKQRPPGSPNP